MPSRTRRHRPRTHTHDDSATTTSLPPSTTTATTAISFHPRGGAAHRAVVGGGNHHHPHHLNRTASAFPSFLHPRNSNSNSSNSNSNSSAGGGGGGIGGIGVSYPRPAFRAAGKELVEALGAARGVCEELLGRHEEGVEGVKGFAGREVLDGVWAARVWAAGAEGEGEEGEDVEGEEEGGQREVRERRLREKVREFQGGFADLVAMAGQEVDGMRVLVVEMDMLGAVLKSVLEVDAQGVAAQDS
ncbi:uncharacterized protein BKCO1_5900043 [Diplodia corticola]|uniref:Uncharacterized protein n=1 Tax=Diplodia corticola TaxID=236234 RepID=A0A1J9RRL4_9PEZI|nr:uncharacterized protein BKCO1_5900043 [Diplodia corticola]OJD30540.1 hypothetical protein BKCO1_5900043 [Diplodia corticola]